MEATHFVTIKICVFRRAVQLKGDGSLTLRYSISVAWKGIWKTLNCMGDAHTTLISLAKQPQHMLSRHMYSKNPCSASTVVGCKMNHYRWIGSVSLNQMANGPKSKFERCYRFDHLQTKCLYIRFCGLALDLRICEDEGDAFTLHSCADAQGFQVFEKRIVVVGLCNGDPRAPAA